MKINEPTGKTRDRCAGQPAFTLIEVVFAASIAALVLAGMFEGYNMVGRRAQYSADNLAASAMAMGQLEKVISTQWIPSEGNYSLLNRSSTNTNNLCLPSANGSVITCTNYTTVSNISTTPPYAYVQVQCIWSLPTYGGTYTNTVAVIRAPNL
jgi:type II secretory pathway pseudopilin PulG